MKFRAPWRWQWGAILALLLRCGAWALALSWSPFFGIPLAFWISLKVVVGYSGPHSPGPPRKGLENETAGQFVFEQDNPDRPHHWKVTVRE